MLQEYITNLYSYKNKKPQLIGHLSIENLKHFLDGTLFTLKLCGHHDVVSVLTRPWWAYVYLYYGIHPYETTVGWYIVIREHSENEEEAIQMFFILLKKYLSEYYPDIVVPE